MIKLPQQTCVLIVGAGPTGLMMAVQLLRNGLHPVIIDSKTGPTDQSKALAVQARSLEIYRQLGIANRAVEGGKRAGGMAFNLEGKPVAALPLNELGKNYTLFPFIHLYQQSKNERLLLNYLTQACCPVYWETTLINLTENNTNAEVTLQRDKVKHHLTCSWVVGADGAHSAVRQHLGIPFTGDTYQHRFYLADVKLADVPDTNMISLFLSKKGFAGFFPMPEERCYRIIGGLPLVLEDKERLGFTDVLPHLAAITGTLIKTEQVKWFTLYQLHHRMASKFKGQRCFLTGDAAHIHSPVGGQGMNTGLQDAYNLGWKLAAVIKGQINDTILNSYAAERMPVAKDLLITTDRVFNIITSRNWLSGILKQYVLPKALKLFWSNKNLKEYFFRRVSQTGINYRDSKISLHLSNGARIKAGDRIPYLKLFDEKKQQQTDMHAWCSKPGFTLITLGDIPESYLFTLAKWITQRYANGLNFFHLPPSATNQNVFDALEVKQYKRKAMIIRPDMHIGYMNDVVDIELMDNYLENVMGFISRNIGTG